MFREAQVARDLSTINTSISAEEHVTHTKHIGVCQQVFLIHPNGTSKRTKRDRPNPRHSDCHDSGSTVRVHSLLGALLWRLRWRRQDRDPGGGAVGVQDLGHDLWTSGQPTHLPRRTFTTTRAIIFAFPDAVAIKAKKPRRLGHLTLSLRS